MNQLLPILQSKLFKFYFYLHGKIIQVPSENFFKILILNILITGITGMHGILLFSSKMSTTNIPSCLLQKFCSIQFPLLVL